MIKLLHVVAIGALISSALYAYTIKYDTLYQGEQLAKLKVRVLKEREAIAVLKAEWQHLNRPDRLQMLANQHLNLQSLGINQIVRFSDVPAKGPKVDSIAQKLDALGLGREGRDEAPTASIPRSPSAVTAPRPRVAGPVTPRPATKPQAVTPRPATAGSPATAAARPATAPMRLMAATPIPRPPASVPFPNRSQPR